MEKKKKILIKEIYLMIGKDKKKNMIILEFIIKFLLIEMLIMIIIMKEIIKLIII